MSILVVDVGTSGVRSGVVQPDSSIDHVHFVEVLPTSPAPAFVELDPVAIARATLEVAQHALHGAGEVQGIAVANQRASVIVWDRRTGEPVGPGIGWQDLRTVGMCLALKEQGITLAPNESATKLAMLLDMADPERSRDLCFGTVDTWVLWTLSGGTLHVTDSTNAGMTGLRLADGTGWDDGILEALRIPARVLPEVVDSSGSVGEASVLEGSPTICGIAGDQQASLIGQGCTLPGMTKATFGTGAMLDCCIGHVRPAFIRRGAAGTFPICAWQRAGHITWGVEAIMLSAGSCVEWLRDDLGVIDSAASSDEIAASCEDTGDVWFVPALVGMGTPVWDFGARGTFVGITLGTKRSEIVRAVLEGIAHRGADLLEAVESDTGLEIDRLRVDGGMCDNGTFVAALADAIGRPVEVSSVREATTLGAAYLAGMALGIWNGEEDVAAAWKPSDVVEPTNGNVRRATNRERWFAARDRALDTVPELSTLEF
jgi:glycerol kinase